MAKKGTLFGKPRGDVIKNPGAFTRKAKAAGKSTSAMASAVKKNPGNYSTSTRKQAALDRAFQTMRNRK
jgi:hypothetical protein